MTISDEAVEAAAKFLSDCAGTGAGNWEWHVGGARELLDAVAPILLSHEREQTRLAHIDAMVNRETKRAELAEVWDEGYRACNSKRIYENAGGAEPDTTNPYRPAP